MKTQINKWGNSLGSRIPKHIVAEIGLEAGDELDWRLESGELRVVVVRQSKEPTLEELLEMPLEREPEIDWGKPQGEEW